MNSRMRIDLRAQRTIAALTQCATQQCVILETVYLWSPTTHLLSAVSRHRTRHVTEDYRPEHSDFELMRMSTTLNTLEYLSCKLYSICHSTCWSATDPLFYHGMLHLFERRPLLPLSVFQCASIECNNKNGIQKTRMSNQTPSSRDYHSILEPCTNQADLNQSYSAHQ